MSLTRMQERTITFHDIRAAVARASRAEIHYEPGRLHEGGVTSWRVFGADLQGDDLVVGIDLVVDHLGSHAKVITVF